jgi:hypothetical protein
MPISVFDSTVLHQSLTSARSPISRKPSGCTRVAMVHQRRLGCSAAANWRRTANNSSPIRSVRNAPRKRAVRMSNCQATGNSGGRKERALANWASYALPFR